MKKIILLPLMTASLLFSESHQDHEAHKFEPTVTLIGDFSYVQKSKELHETYIDGFTHSHSEDDEHDHSSSHSSEGFNFNSAELEIEAPIDELIELRSTFHLSEDSFEVEELYGTTHYRDGLNFKAGKFLSNFGVNNSKHFETWNFANQPLINNVLFGSHGMNEKGISATWNNKNFKVGFELLTGENEMTFGNSEIEDGNISIEGSDNPELNVIYAKYNNRFGTIVFDGGISHATGKARWDHTANDNSSHALTGDVTLFGLDMAFKFPFSRTSNITFLSEYIQRKIDNSIRHAATTTSTKTVKMDQSGLNTSLIYTINSKWKTGIEYDKILKNDKIIDKNNLNKSDDLKRTSLMVEHHLSEHNKLRIQYSKDESKYHDSELLSFNEVLLQWTFAFSTGEHKH